MLTTVTIVQEDACFKPGLHIFLIPATHHLCNLTTYDNDHPAAPFINYNTSRWLTYFLPCVLICKPTLDSCDYQQNFVSRSSDNYTKAISQYWEIRIFQAKPWFAVEPSTPKLMTFCMPRTQSRSAANVAMMYELSRLRRC